MVFFPSWFLEKKEKLALAVWGVNVSLAGSGGV